MNHDEDQRTLNCRGPKRTYYMGGVLFAPRPPFAIQQIMAAPLGVPDAYDLLTERQKWRVVFPLGLIPDGEDSYLVSYGVADNDTRVARFDRGKLAEELQPPLPSGWDGKGGC